MPATDPMPLLQITDLKKSYRAPEGHPVPVLEVQDFRLEEREQLALEGSSGSGKTTLLNLIAGILRPDSGRILFAGRDVSALSEPERDAFRARHVGYVFQSFNLLPGFSALENVLLGALFGGRPDPELARSLLERLDLAQRMGHRPQALSIGQQQRVALARALVNRPALVLADEPTGNLDPQRAGEALELMGEVCREQQAALLCVSHDRAILSRFERVIHMGEINRVSSGGAA